MPENVFLIADPNDLYKKFLGLGEYTGSGNVGAGMVNVGELPGIDERTYQASGTTLSRDEWVRQIAGQQRQIAIDERYGPRGEDGLQPWEGGVGSDIYDREQNQGFQQQQTGTGWNVVGDKLVGPTGQEFDKDFIPPQVEQYIRQLEGSGEIGAQGAADLRQNWYRTIDPGNLPALSDAIEQDGITHSPGDVYMRITNDPEFEKRLIDPRDNVLGVPRVGEVVGPGGMRRPLEVTRNEWASYQTNKVPGETYEDYFKRVGTGETPTSTTLPETKPSTFQDFMDKYGWNTLDVAIKGLFALRQDGTLTDDTKFGDLYREAIQRDWTGDGDSVLRDADAEGLTLKPGIKTKDGTGDGDDKEVIKKKKVFDDDDDGDGDSVLRDADAQGLVLKPLGKKKVFGDGDGDGNGDKDIVIVEDDPKDIVLDKEVVLDDPDVDLDVKPDIRPSFSFGGGEGSFASSFESEGRSIGGGRPQQILSGFMAAPSRLSTEPTEPAFRLSDIFEGNDFLGDLDLFGKKEKNKLF